MRRWQKWRRRVLPCGAAVLVVGAIAATLPVPSAQAAVLRPLTQSDFTGDHVADVLATAGDGSLYLYAGRGGGALGPGRRIGSGWSGVDQVGLAGQFDGTGGPDVVARAKSTGALYLYPTNGSGGWLTRRQIGSGWNGMRTIVAPGDWSGDGMPDLVSVRASDGALLLYPGNGRGGFGAVRTVAAGWSTRDVVVSAGDWDGDGATDLISRDAATGALWLDRGNGAGGIASQRQIGSGWLGMTAIAGVVDADGDRRPDLLARNSAGRLLVYRGNGTGGFLGVLVVGSGWSSFTSIVSASVRADATLPAFTSSVAAIDSATATRMRYSYRAGCPVGLADLRLVRVRYYGFDRVARTGELVVHRTATTAVVGAFRRCMPRGSRSSGWSWSTPTAATTTPRWPPTTPRRSTAARSSGGVGLVGARLRHGHRHQPGAEPLRRRVDGAAHRRPRLPDSHQRPSRA